MWMLYSYRTYDYNCECGGSGIGSVLLQLELEQATQPRPTQRSPPPTTTTLAVPKPNDGKQQLWTHKFFFLPHFMFRNLFRVELNIIQLESSSCDVME
jgi:hypothetical protein